MAQRQILLKLRVLLLQRYQPFMVWQNNRTVRCAGAAGVTLSLDLDAKSCRSSLTHHHDCYDVTSVHERSAWIDLMNG